MLNSYWKLKKTVLFTFRWQERHRPRGADRRWKLSSRLFWIYDWKETSSWRHPRHRPLRSQAAGRVCTVSVGIICLLLFKYELYVDFTFSTEKSVLFWLMSGWTVKSSVTTNEWLYGHFKLGNVSIPFFFWAGLLTAVWTIIHPLSHLCCRMKPRKIKEDDAPRTIACPHKVSVINTNIQKI